MLLIRHALEVDESYSYQIVEALREMSVCVVADSQNLRCHSGQSCLVTFVQLVQAMGCRVKLVMPEMPIMGPQPPLVGSDLRGALVEYGRDSMPDSSIELVDRPSDIDLVFVLGDCPFEWPRNYAWRLYGGAWWGAVTTVNDRASRWAGEFPVGACVAAAIAAAEPFKAIVRSLISRFRRRPFATEQFDVTLAAKVDLAPGVGASDFVLLGDVDVTSAGAISMASMHCLLRCPDLAASFRIIDPDVLGLPNMNRAPLTLLSNLGEAKVDAIARWSRPPEVLITGIQKRLNATAALELADFAPSCLVGCDDIPTRWLVQERMPQWVAVGSTADFFTLTSEHTPNTPCARCLHREDDNFRGTVATVSFVSYWAGLLIAARLLRRAAGYPSSVAQQALNLVPLRLDLPNAARWGPVTRWSGCPICS